MTLNTATLLHKRTLNRRCWWDQQGVRRCEGLPVGAIVAIALAIVLIVSAALTLACRTQIRKTCCGHRSKPKRRGRALAQRSSSTKTRSELAEDVESNASVIGDSGWQTNADTFVSSDGRRPLMVEDSTMPRLPTLSYASGGGYLSRDATDAVTEDTAVSRDQDVFPSPTLPTVPQPAARLDADGARRNSRQASLSRNSMTSQSSKSKSHRRSASTTGAAIAPPPMRGWPAGLIAASSRPPSSGQGRERESHSSNAHSQRARQSVSSSRRSSTHAALPSSTSTTKPRGSGVDVTSKNQKKMSASKSLPTSPEISRRSLEDDCA
ncbi:hypothetical protein IE81DRAFT_344673 [Ceraceosorus guamensis]|uniref:Uncharacterized protein n=1 Tax=Ceraceosorus guamensis TaxID=1522189 RepID=A0A316W654_9BASI|nr:hypothetical protein IE81DRAFT_344673 [Ceraceosorus guamensis]PWN45359.1 hypothetical protein IE81DRAFT_344673 [Ceraceosorus guamensis]